MTLDWKSVKRAKLPEDGSRVVVCNDINEWVTDWKPGLMSALAPHPVTYFAALERPYERSVEIQVANARKRYQKG